MSPKPRKVDEGFHAEWRAKVCARIAAEKAALQEATLQDPGSLRSGDCNPTRQPGW